MDLRWKLLPGLFLAFFAGREARADFLELSQRGVADLQNTQVAACIKTHVDPLQGGRYGFLRGMILTQHDAAGLLAYDPTFDMSPGLSPADIGKLNTPDKVFLFLPYDWITRSATGLSWRTTLIDWKDVSSVRYEVDTLDDLNALVSWARCQAPPNSNPNQVTNKLQSGLGIFLKELDPNNKWGIGGPGPPGAPPPNQHEGSITRYLLYDRMSGPERVKRMQDCRQNKGPIGNYGQPYTSQGIRYSATDPDWGDETAETTMASLLEGMARCRPNPQAPTQTLYNIPNAGLLRTNARVVAQFITADLAGVDPNVVKGPPADLNAQRVLEYALRARKAVLTRIMAASPDNVYRLTKPGMQPPRLLLRPGEQVIDAQLRATNVDDDLPASVFDVADAALDVLLFVSNSGSTGMKKALQVDQSQIVDTLLALGAGIPAFNGGAQVLGIQGTIGNKALWTLMGLAADPDPQVGAKFRQELLNRVENATNVTIAKAATEILKRADLMNANTTRPDVEKSIEALFDVALSPPVEESNSYYYSPPSSGFQLPPIDPRTIDATYVLKQIAKNGASNAAKSIATRVDLLKKKRADKLETSAERRFLELYDAIN
jgi:hypothetical protein